MNRLAGLIWLFWTCSCLQAVELTNLRSRTGDHQTRVVFELSATVKYKVFTLSSPDRLVVDLQQTAAGPGLELVNDQVIRSMRLGKRNQSGLRVVLDLTRPVTPKSFLIAPDGKSGHRLVVDLQFNEKPKIKVSAAARGLRDQPQRPVLVVIDPGHGGKDPGALGHKGLQEKDVVLAISKELAKLINQAPGMQALLTRSDDRIIKLSKRRQIAREHQADLFLSIHANSFSSSRVKGSAVYALSEKGASSAAAQALADKENAADLIGGIDLSDKDDLVKSVLLDLSQNATQQSSLQLADRVLQGLGGVNKIHKKEVQTAGFVVLKSASVPSVLIETAFISNPGEEKLLGSRSGQRKLAKAILRGVKAFVQQDMSLRLANAGASYGAENRTHLVRRGDTLSALAQRYGVGLGRLRAENSIRGDRLLVGKELLIPGGQGS
ncbi:MAG: N-acetylmuramoyl-L-alanine amidase [Immundisolibacteraceae bacterium]|nr:N-acetylmuramoyl-L-alanine amidase [Immundisolibacteraceae bacterium]